MKFEDLTFPGKEKVKYYAIHEIMDILEHSLVVRNFSYLSIVRYVEILVEQQDYNPKTGVFYDEITHKKLNYNFLASIAKDYIMDHLTEFQYKVI